MANVVVCFHGGKPSDNWIQCKLHKNNRFLNWVTGRSIEPDPVWVPMNIAFVMCFPSITGFSTKSSLAEVATMMTMDARKSKQRLVYEQNKNSENIYGRLLSCHWITDLIANGNVFFCLLITICHLCTVSQFSKTTLTMIVHSAGNIFISRTHMSSTLDQIPEDKTWSPTDSSRKMKPEV